MDESVDTRTCPACGRVLPASDFVSSSLGVASECVECTWARMCQLTPADLEELARVYRRYRGEDRVKILERLRRRFAADPKPERLLPQAEAGYIEFTAEMRKRRTRTHGAGGRHTIEDVKRLYDEQGGRCLYCGKELNGEYKLDHKTPLSRGGNDWPENLCCACEQCNRLKQSKTAEEFTEYLTNLRRRRPRLP